MNLSDDIEYVSNAGDTQFCQNDNLFDKSNVIRCEQDGLIYENDEITILNEVNGSYWKSPLVSDQATI